jgi:hypothetical protein
MASMDSGNEFVAVGIVIVAVLVFLFPLITSPSILLWILLLVSICFFYLGLRLVRAVERIATALEERPPSE